MARKVFFSFHYDNDVTRANIVRNSWVTKPDTATAGFIDHADFEKLMKNGTQAVKNWIDDQLIGSSATVVLIGSETLTRPFVKYELEQSFKKGNAIIGIYIDKLKNLQGNTTTQCSIYGVEIGKTASGSVVHFSGCPVYDWVNDNGYENMGKWIEDAINKK